MIGTGEQNSGSISESVMGYCAVIVVKGLGPKHFMARNLKIGEEDHFQFLARSGRKWLMYTNIGRDLDETEIEALKRNIANTSGDTNVECKNGILVREAPEVLWKFFEDINSVGGCRISPNALQKEGNTYLSVEFQETKKEEISRILVEFLGKGGQYSKEVLYIGKQEGNYPMLLNLYRTSGNSLSDFSVVETLWEPSEEEVTKQNTGIFQNHGIFAPKYFFNGDRDVIIARISSQEIKGNADCRIIDDENRIVEFNITSHFFSDFHKEVVESYSGPIFYSLEVNERGVFSYYVIDSEVKQLFLSGLYRHWKKPSRIEHKNYITGVFRLDAFIKDRKVPF